ncbi:hypothetical protein EUZ85_26605 [Hahella sp. KA22]|uniref:hypothetical protein n=1 Tax=Hahella sp. KA22 TaxID=1628392 RepID=UPI000FDD8828|nr:hypothetical protein [Hahella sp. KA22]AZZ94094.1 hypothetical protein ENC22_24020 [Hahella sp. KA22]QAY57468.1 hypothetical protein EUZ85_26605 [Hahella sp. KA22]
MASFNIFKPVHFSGRAVPALFGAAWIDNQTDCQAIAPIELILIVFSRLRQHTDANGVNGYDK